MKTLRQACDLGFTLSMIHAVADEWGGGGAGGQYPQPEIKLKSCPTKPKFALADFNHFLPKLQVTLVYFKMAMPFLRKKNINQYISAVVPMSDRKQGFVLFKFTYS